MTANVDDDLEALFDQISDQRMAEIRSEGNNTPAAAPANDLPVNDPSMVVAAAVMVSAAEQLDVDAKPDARELYQRVGGLTRQLHDALRELGYDKNVENAVNALPDARARLGYIAKMTEQAAERALSAVEKGQEGLSKVGAHNGKLLTSWDKLFSKQLSLDEFKQLAHDTHAHLKQVSTQTSAAHAQFTEIMMAQDFQDLTGQVIQKIGTVSQNLEQQLIKLLVDSAPPERRAEVHTEWMNGPAINTDGRSDVVNSQGQVDDLLESLGF
ncbi:MAG: protein phosphatase CheZ [Burkholderiaceae bacterium]|nr:MAG: protein phosphatase CheZ [Burkholderiaceae bacterium]